MMRWAFAVALAVLTAIGLGGAATSAVTPPGTCTKSSPLVCIDIVGSPETVPPSEGDSPRYVFYTATVTNGASSAITHVAVTADLSAGLKFVSATSSVGSCTDSSCSLGKLASGAHPTIDVVAQAPTTKGSENVTFTASFDERANDSSTPDPKQDSVSATHETSVDTVSGTASSFVPEGASVELTTDAKGSGVATSGDPLIGDVEITSSPMSVTALIEEVAAPVSCPKRVVCRGGPWLHASIPGTFDPPLAFGLRWDRSLIPAGETMNKFAVLYTECLTGCPLQVIAARCSSATPDASELPCLTGVAKLSDGDWVATLVNSHNGHMR
jgi:uncharacterized repeat protein (TIGR01451 family)